MLHNKCGVTTLCIWDDTLGQDTAQQVTKSATYSVTVSYIEYLLCHCKLHRVLTIVAKATADLYRTVSPKESCIAMRSVK